MLGWQEILLILVLALVIFGGKKLPEVGKSLGKAMREFKNGISGIDEKNSDNFEINNVKKEQESREVDNGKK